MPEANKVGPDPHDTIKSLDGFKINASKSSSPKECTKPNASNSAVGPHQLKTMVSQKTDHVRNVVLRNTTINRVDIVHKTVKKRSKQLLLMAFYSSVIWNVLSPFKSWVLGRYSLRDHSQILITNVNWTMHVDPVFLAGLYSSAGIVQDRPGKSERFINIYLDFMIHQKSRRWAPYVNNKHKDEYAGRYCRTGFRYNSKKQLDDIKPISKEGVLIWSDMFYKFMVDQKVCRVSEVPEAILCLKGFRALDLLNLEWTTQLKTNDSAVINAMNAWQEKLMPDLENCLSRREVLIKLMGYNEGLIKLSEEIAKNFSLILENVAGRSQIYAKFVQEEGFIDISGDKSGTRTVQLNGHMYSRNMKDLDGDLNAMSIVRETLWICAYKPPKDHTFKQCLLKLGHTVPAFTIMKYLNLKVVSERYLENDLFEKGPNIDKITQYNLRMMQPYKPKYEYVNEVYFREMVESGYQKIFNNLLEDEFKFRRGSLTGGTKICLVSDDCFPICKRTTSLGRWTIAFKRSGVCQLRRISSDVLNNNGYVSIQCFGIGTGRSSLYLEVNDAVGQNLTIKRMANPNSVLACVLGGRIPNGEYMPSYFSDTIEPGTGSVVMSVVVDGSEKTLLSFYTLVTLLGCVCFAYWVIVETNYLHKNLLESVRKLSDVEMSQAVHGIYYSSIASRVWGRHFYRMQIAGSVSLISWFLSTTNTSCKWTRVGQNSSISPEYFCNPGGVFNMLSSVSEIIRLLSASYVFFALIFQCDCTLIGITRNSRLLAICVLFFGLIPCFLNSVLISWINILRFSIGAIWIHNQLFIAAIWFILLFCWSRIRVVWIRYGSKMLYFFGQSRQQVKPGTLAHEYIGNYFWTNEEDVIDEAIEWIPLSLYLELQAADLSKICWETRCIMTDGLSTKRNHVDTPSWVLNSEDYYIR